MTDSELFRHYLAKGSPEAAAWNLSPECAYLDYRLRTWARELVGRRQELSVLNVGIGVGEWDDFLGYLLAGSGTLTSVDNDATICDTLRARQQREGHPNPATVVCADLLAWQSHQRFDLVTIVGSTLPEIGDTHAAVRAALSLLAAGGRVALLTIGDEPDLHGLDVMVLRRETDSAIRTAIRLAVLVAA